MLFVILAWAYVMKTMNRPENAKLLRGRSTIELCGTYANLLWSRTEEHNNQLKWKQRLHHLFPLRALLLHKLRSLKEEMLRYQVNSQSDASANADRDEDERSFDLGGVSHCSSSLPWQPYETYLSGCLHCSAIVILHVQCWEPRRLWERSERARQKLLNFLPSSRSYFTQFTIWVVGSTRRHLSTLISCFPQLFTLFPKIRLLILSPAPYTHASSLTLIQFVSRVIIALFLSGCCCTFLSFGL